MNANKLWNEMLDEFRALGGVADNVRLGYGAFGRGLFPVDPKQPVRISIPSNLLVSFEDVTFDGDVFRVSDRSSVSARGRTFLEQYERDFSWGVGRLETERFIEMMSELPENLKRFLASELDLGRLLYPISPPFVQTLFLGNRIIRAANRRVVMPIVELANHGGTAQYNRLGGVSLSGIFDGEVLVRYANPTDPYDMFVNWMFAPNEGTAFSLAVQGTFEGKQLEIGRAFDDETMPFLPKVKVEGDRIAANYLLLGHQQFPQVPKGVFRKAMRFAHLPDVDEVYDFIHMVNCQKFLTLLAMLDGIDGPAAAMLRKLACNQLMALSQHFGARDV